MKTLKGLTQWVLMGMLAVLTGCTVEDSDDYDAATKHYEDATNASFEGVWTINGQTLGTGYMQVGETVSFTNFPFAALANYALTGYVLDKATLDDDSSLLINSVNSSFGAEVYKIGFSDEADYDLFYKSDIAATSLLRTTVNGMEGEACQMTMAVDWPSSNMVTDSRNGTLVCKLVVSSVTLKWQESKEEKTADGPYVLTFTSTRRM